MIAGKTQKNAGRMVVILKWEMLGVAHQHVVAKQKAVPSKRVITSGSMEETNLPPQPKFFLVVAGICGVRALLKRLVSMQANVMTGSWETKANV